MKRTTVFLPDDLEREIQGLARREGRPVASCVREALAQYVASKRAPSSLPSFVGVGASDAGDVAERHEALLWTDPHGDGPAKPPRRRRGAVR
jgi:predicted transcriptional regulator